MQASVDVYKLPGGYARDQERRDARVAVSV